RETRGQERGHWVRPDAFVYPRLHPSAHHIRSRNRFHLPHLERFDLHW
ncbi:unnamed protein product, partial [Cyprideis torosa]